MTPLRQDAKRQVCHLHVSNATQDPVICMLHAVRVFCDDGHVPFLDSACFAHDCHEIVLVIIYRSCPASAANTKKPPEQQRYSCHARILPHGV